MPTRAADRLTFGRSLFRAPMTIATKLTRKLDEVLGTEAAETMVDWMQQVEGNRAELRELNDLSFARFDSRLNERIAQLESKMHSEISGLRVEMQTGFANVAVALEKQKVEL